MVVSLKRTPFSCWWGPSSFWGGKMLNLLPFLGTGRQWWCWLLLDLPVLRGKGHPQWRDAAGWNLETLPAFKNTNLSQCQKLLLPPRKGSSAKRSWNWWVAGLGFILTLWISCYFKFKVASASHPAQSLALFCKRFWLIEWGSGHCT